MKPDAEFMRAEMAALAKLMREWEREDRARAKEGSDEREVHLARADAHGHVADELRRILAGKTSVQALAEKLQRAEAKRAT